MAICDSTAGIDMKQDELIEMYLQVSKELCNDTEWCWAGVGEPLQMFAKLVVAKEREACAKVCYELPAPDIYSNTDKSMWGVTCIDCATAIRARGQA
jgi:hypothetical protein